MVSLYDKLLFIFNLTILLSLLVVGFTFADSNGIWESSEEIRTGTFGSNTDFVSGEYEFNGNGLIVQEKTLSVKTISSNSDGNILIQLN